MPDRVTLGILCVVAISLACGCGDSGSSADDDSGSGASSSSGTAPPPGPSAEGWRSAYADGGVGVRCGDSAQDMEAAGAPSLTVGETTLFVGYQQDGQNQNPVVARFDAGEPVWCAHHETEGPDGRALGITWDGGEAAYVVYTIVGGGSSLEGKDGWLSAYAPGAISGGGPKVSYVGRVLTNDGGLESGSFIIAVKMDGKVNSHNPADAVTVLQDGDIEFRGGSAHKPIDANGQQSMDCTDYPFDTRYRLSPDLSSLSCADATNCVAEQPCE